MFIAPSIYKIPTSKGSNVYVLSDEDGLILIDVGSIGSYDSIIDYIESYLDADEEDIKTIIITHGHPDHAGSLPDFVSSIDVKVIVHKNEISYISKKVFWGKKFTPSIAIENDYYLDAFGGLKILWTPGHTQGSISIYKEGVFLATGDTLIVDKLGKVNTSLKEKNFNTDELRKSLCRLSKLKFDILLPGHGRPIIERADSLVKKFYEDIKLGKVKID